MRILIIANSSGGLFDFRQELIYQLSKTNDVSVYVPNNGMIDEIKSLGCSVYNLNIDRRGINPRKDFVLFKRIKSILKEKQPDLVITYTIKPNIYGGLACRMLKVPYAVNITGLGSAFQKDGFLKILVSFMYKLGLKSSKVVFFENEENRHIFIKKRIIPERNTCLLMGAGVNLDRYMVSEYPNGKTVKFLFMGRVMKEKGIDELFTAMKKLISDGINCTLDVVGECEENYKDIIDHYEAEGWLYYRGYQKDVRPFIKASHCSVLPSWHEGMSNSNLECAASGRPVITSNIHGCLEAIEDNVSGYLCEKRNPDDLYRVMKKFTKLSYEERKAMGEAGRKRMESFFDKKEVVKNTISRLM